jgi:methionyl-tRNA formyltransferase
MKIVFMGTPDFAVPSLAILVENGYDVAAVVTVPDKPAGRGQQLQQSAVKKYAVEKHLHLLQPEKLRAEDFNDALKEINADLFIVVAFRMLPEMVWSLPPLGCFNLHGSLLPKYRGAAPLNWAIINGEKETGLSTFFLQHAIDTGEIIDQVRIPISENMNVSELHDEAMDIGAKLVLKTVQAIEKSEVKTKSQDAIIEENGWQKDALPHAPKIFKADTVIDWNKSVRECHNFIRGLSQYPVAICEFQNLQLKIYKALPVENEKQATVGSFDSDGKTYLHFKCADGWISLLDVQLEGKKRMLIDAFLRGFRF